MRSLSPLVDVSPLHSLVSLDSSIHCSFGPVRLYTDDNSFKGTFRNFPGLVIFKSPMMEAAQQYASTETWHGSAGQMSCSFPGNFFRARDLDCLGIQLDRIRPYKAF